MKGGVSLPFFLDKEYNRFFRNWRPFLFKFILLTMVFFSSNLLSDESKSLKDLVMATAMKYYQSENIYDRFSGACTLIDLGEEEPLKFVVEQLFSGDFIVMRHAIDTILSVSHPSAPDIISRAIERIEDGVFLKFITESLSKRSRSDMFEILLDLTESEDPWVVKHSMQSIDMIDFSGKIKLLNSLISSEDSDDIIKAYSYMALAKLTPQDSDIEKKLIDFAQNGTRDTREAAAVGLGRVSSAKARLALRELRNSNQPSVQIAALGSEVGLGFAESREKLIEIILYGKGLDPTVAAASIRRMPYDMAVSITTELIDCCELNSEVGARLLEAWGELGAPPATITDWGLNHQNQDIKMQAVWLIGSLKIGAYTELLTKELENDDSGIATMAAWSLLRIMSKV